MWICGIDQFERLVVEKSTRRLTAFGGEPVLVLDMALGFAPIGDKTQRAMGKRPKASFTSTGATIAARFTCAGSRLPPAEDRLSAAAQGVDPGGDIFIHGQQINWDRW